LTNPLKPEIQDTHDRRMRKLMEPKSVQQWFDIAQGASSEERFYNSMRLLEQWNFTYDKHEKKGNVSINVLTPREKRVKEALMRLVVEKNKECSKVIESIMERMYSDIKDTPLFKKVRNSLVEASKQLMKIHSHGPTTETVKSYTNYIESIMKSLTEILPSDKAPKDTVCKEIVLNNLLTMMPNSDKTDKGYTDEAEWEQNRKLKHSPRIARGNLVLRAQHDIQLNPNEIVPLPDTGMI